MVSTSVDPRQNVLCGILMSVFHRIRSQKQNFANTSLLYVCGETESPADRSKAKHTKDRFGETGSATNRQRDKQRKTGRARDTQQADGGA